MSPVGANVIALGLTTVVNTAANRRFSFGVRGVQDALRHQVQGLLVFGVGLTLTTGSILLLPSGTSAAVEVVVLTATNLAVTVLRFAAMRWWMFRSSPTVHPEG
jgi:putative flippase GtrA